MASIEIGDELAVSAEVRYRFRLACTKDTPGNVGGGQRRSVKCAWRRAGWRFAKNFREGLRRLSFVRLTVSNGQLRGRPFQF
jgi:hypothetical protein